MPGRAAAYESAYAARVSPDRRPGGEEAGAEEGLSDIESCLSQSDARVAGLVAISGRKTQVAEAEEFKCPIPAAEDKFQEAHYFISGMLEEYHHPSPFRWNLNAFLQALRSVTFILQSEMAHVPGFQEWYQEQRGLMREDPLLRLFVSGRDIVVHKGMLTRRSIIEVGLFRGRSKFKLGFTEIEVSPDMPSEVALKGAVEQLVGFILDEEHSAIDEQIGVRRLWLVEELGDGEVIGLCDRAWSRIGSVLASAHAFLGARFEPPPEEGHDVELVRVLLESDIDPTLPRKWGWVD